MFSLIDKVGRGVGEICKDLIFFYGSLSTVVGDEKLTSREDLIGLLFFYVQSD